MIAKEIIQGGYEIGKALGRNLQGILEPIQLLKKKDTFGLGFQPIAKDKREMQPHKKVKKEGKQIVMSILPLHYTFPRPSRIILSKLDEKNLFQEVEVSLSQLFVGAICEDEPLEDMEFPNIPEGAM